MGFDLVTVSFVTALVVIVAGVVFLLETLLHAPSAATRLWSVSFLAGILTSFCYLVWALGVSGAWIATAAGNAAFTLSSGFLWLGCRRFNEHSTRIPSIVTTLVSLAAAVAALAGGPDGGDWAGALVMFVGIAVFAALGTVESRRGTMGRQTVAITITAVLALTSLYYLARTVVFVATGPQSWLFLTWFGTITTSFLTITLTMTAVVGFSVLRATEASLRGRGEADVLEITGDGLFNPYSFEAVLERLTRRSEREGEGMAVIALRLDDLPQIALAFGAQEAAELTQAWRVTVEESAPVGAVVGEEGPYGVMVSLPTSTLAEARSYAVKLQQRVIDALSMTGAAVIPVVGVGIALTQTTGYDASTLIDASNEAARRSAVNADAAVVVAG